MTCLPKPPPLPPIYHPPGHYFPHCDLRLELPPKLAKAKGPPKEGPNLSPRPRSNLHGAKIVIPILFLLSFPYRTYSTYLTLLSNIPTFENV